MQKFRKVPDRTIREAIEEVVQAISSLPSARASGGGDGGFLRQDQAIDLTSGRSTTLHYHAKDRDLVLHPYTNPGMAGVGSGKGALDWLADRIHAHENKGVLDGLSDVDGKLVYLAQTLALSDHTHEGIYAPLAHAHGWLSIQDKPTTFPPEAHGHAWTEISEKPLAYPPEAHDHGWDEITEKPIAFPPAAHDHAGVYVPVDDLSVHTHANKAVLDKFGDSGGQPTYNGEVISGGGGSTPYDPMVIDCGAIEAIHTGDDGFYPSSPEIDFGGF